MNDLWIDIKYANIISNSLEKCKDKSQNGLFKLNFRCSYCGDSLKNKYKTRGWIFQKSNTLFYKCFNCGISTSFHSFLKSQNNVLYNEYRLERFKEFKRDEIVVPETKKMIVKTDDIFKGLKNISSLSLFHGARKYVNSRKIPVDKIEEIYYVENFYHWINNSVIIDKFSENTLKNDEERIVFPFRNKEGEIFGLQGRSLDRDSSLRYITLMMNDNYPKIFGLDKHEKNVKTYVVEGPIDSLFLPNCLAMAGADANLDSIVNKSLTTIIFDNEPRNAEIVARMYKYINQGWSICIWPENITKKDINDLILDGISPVQLKKLIDENSFSNLRALLKLKYWSKV